MKNFPKKLLIIILWLIGIHSFIIGLCLIFLPAVYMPLFGFELCEFVFFRAQGGIFHLIMSVIYVWAAIYIDKTNVLIKITLLAKTMALIFLLIYYIFVDPVITILLSGITDGLMAIVVLVLYLNIQKTKPAYT